MDFDTLLKESDYITPHCPLNEHTKHLFNLDTFKKMKPTAIFINTTRSTILLFSPILFIVMMTYHPSNKSIIIILINNTNVYK